MSSDRTGTTSVSRERLLEFLREMQLIRRFEEKVIERFRASDLAGFLHACIGQEAVAVGVCRALGDAGVMGSTHRAPHGHVIANGTPPNEVMAELYMGKAEGCSPGYGGSMHLYDVRRGTKGANAVVGGGLPAAVGAALAFKLRNERRVSLAFFGDGATNIGTFHESMNLAQLRQLPVAFVCENNHWSESTPQSRRQPIRDLTTRPRLPSRRSSGRSSPMSTARLKSCLSRSKAHREPFWSRSHRTPNYSWSALAGMGGSSGCCWDLSVSSARITRPAP
jgi:TPP-dependent pyruvate/acetoin dehydrogenase alpha subunit